jgi:GntR family transcriptional regulator/MocR family aminotransferase
VVVGDGVDGALRRRLFERQANVLPIALGSSSSQALESVPSGAVLIVSAQQFAGPDAAARERSRALLDIARERDALVIEFAPPPELKESRRATLSLRTLDPSGRVLFVSGLSSVAAFGSPPGFISGDARLCERIRELRRAVGSELSPGLQRAWSYFVGLGHYAAWMARANRVLQGRRTALRDALQHYLHKFVAIESIAGGSAYRVIGPAEMNSLELARAASGLGVLVEPDEGNSRNVLRMGVTSVPKESIRAGVELLARLIRGDQRLGSRRLEDDPLRPLTGKALQRALSGKTLLYNTVYGDPCTIHVRSDGALVGRAGYANEGCDTGRWWVEDGRWFRQWQHWAYGEALGLVTIVDGDQVRWFKSDGLLIDTALIVREKRRNSR